MFSCVFNVYTRTCACLCMYVVTIITKEQIIIINLYYKENKLNRRKCMVGLKCKNVCGENVSA